MRAENARQHRGAGRPSATTATGWTARASARAATRCRPSSSPTIIEIRRCTADFVLLVEKGTQWNRLSEDKFWRRYNCVLLTGNGQPPRGVRRLARRLHEEYKLPVYVLVDNDPWGYYIYSVVKQGSINLAFESERMAIPKAKFIGLSSADPDRYGLPRNVGIKLNDKDISRAKELLKYRWFQKKAWQDEIKRHARERPQVRARRARQQGLPLPDQDLPAEEAQGRGLAGLVFSRRVKTASNLYLSFRTNVRNPAAESESGFLPSVEMTAVQFSCD